jgi:hypothetical protein
MKRMILLASLGVLITVVLALGVAGLVLAQENCSTDVVDGIQTETCTGAIEETGDTPGGGGGRTETTCTLIGSVCTFPTTEETSGGSGGPGAGSGGHTEQSTTGGLTKTITEGTRSGGGSEG